MKDMLGLRRIKIPNAVLLRSAKVAVVVGTILNMINQADAVFGSGESDLVKAGLTYCVPFFVAMYGALAARRDYGKTALGRDP
ncbi:hypothetical protein RA2_01224 [Roseovarius sp. A-2]|uniref:nitrate/nitrite transporter NrtS n=1 Tax=Roseovarius sp. A-2 TaxID=1570360 RepID=UPI0009D34572|nr:nitrate/nitrite transporter NrtS [Roseovarius sp. A-2]GAW34179.1 hypothetical protein RA2_01224 [Roseovarius sp. A-2]